jgi:hypothetical protein
MIAEGCDIRRIIASEVRGSFCPAILCWIVGGFSSNVILVISCVSIINIILGIFGLISFDRAVWVDLLKLEDVPLFRPIFWVFSSCFQLGNQMG